MKTKLFSLLIIIILITIISSCFDPAENTLEINGVMMEVSDKDSRNSSYELEYIDSIYPSDIKLNIQLSERHYLAKISYPSLIKNCYAFQYITENIFINRLEDFDVWFCEIDDSTNITNYLSFDYETLQSITKETLIDEINNKIDYHSKNATNWPHFEFEAFLSKDILNYETTGYFTINLRLDDRTVFDSSNNIQVKKENYNNIALKTRSNLH